MIRRRTFVYENIVSKYLPTRYLIVKKKKKEIEEYRILSQLKREALPSTLVPRR
jgi:hypothetical protein